ncbi:MAG TPA: GGDEF domain-containing protein [Solirubrobacterales bacterium]|nr:GGDEF domain-containing protein [Solirubrobacterales bacterium]
MSSESFVEAEGPKVHTGSWLCESEADRVRMLDMENRLRPVRVLTLIAIGIALALCGPWIGFWALAPLAGAGAGFVLAGRWIKRRSLYPEYAMMSAWVAAQLAIGGGVALSGGPKSPALALVAVPIVSLSARFSIRGVAFGVMVSVLIITMAAMVDTGALLDNPTYTLLAIAAVVSVGVLSTALMRSDVQYRTEAVLDPLTGLLNRKALESRASELEQQSEVINQPIGMIVADIDKFKRVNDEHGHVVGDAVLTDVAYLMRKELRAFDHAYRIGGEEFVILLPGATLDDAARLAEQVRLRIAGTPVAGGLEITVSMGVGGSGAGEAFDYEHVFANADAALLEAKQQGRNCVRRDNRQIEDEAAVHGGRSLETLGAAGVPK